MTTIINLTPHAINFLGADGAALLTVAPSGTVARCATTATEIGDIDGIPIRVSTFGDVVGLPAPVAGTILIVSAITAQAVKGLRDDVFIPDDAVRDDAGRIIGCRALGRV